MIFPAFGNHSCTEADPQHGARLPFRMNCFDRLSYMARLAGDTFLLGRVTVSGQILIKHQVEFIDFFICKDMLLVPHEKRENRSSVFQPMIPILCFSRRQDAQWLEMSGLTDT